MTDSIINLKQYKFEQAARDLRLKLIDFSHRTQIQAQIGEAFYIWKNDPELIEQDYEEEDISDITFTKFLDWFIYDFKLIDIGKNNFLFPNTYCLLTTSIEFVFHLPLTIFHFPYYSPSFIQSDILDNSNFPFLSACSFIIVKRIGVTTST